MRQTDSIEKVEEGMSISMHHETWALLVSVFDPVNVGKLFHLLGLRLSRGREWWCWGHASLGAVQCCCED